MVLLVLPFRNVCQIPYHRLQRSSDLENQVVDLLTHRTHGTGWHCLTNDFRYLQNEKGNAMRQGMRIRKVNYCMHIFALSRADPPSVAQCFATRLRHSRFHLRSLLHTFDALHAVQIVNCALLMVAQNLTSPCGSIRIQRNCMVNMRLPSHH